VEETQESIFAVAIECARKSWEQDKKPFLLAKLTPEFIKNGLNYRNVLGEMSLKEFFMGAPDKITVVAHPTQKAKIGLIPVGEQFQYEISERPSAAIISFETTSVDRQHKGGRRRYLVMNFLQLLSELDEKDAVQVQIPTHILAKLVRD